jgi:stage II sporulation protein AA (anti-sigma F factor antagonist)
MLKTEMSEGKIILKFENRLDTVACSAVEGEVLAQLEKNQAPVVFDIGRVDFVSSAFLRICIMAAKRAGEGNFKVAHAAPQIKKVFKIAGMDQFLAE